MSGNGRRLDIGIASYGKPQALVNTVEAIKRTAHTDWHLYIVNNPKPGTDLRELISGMVDRDERISACFAEHNLGYAGAVNVLMESLCGTEYRAYLDDDCTMWTPGWDESFCHLLDMFHEVGMVFPNGGAHAIDRTNYLDITWAAGFCFAINAMAWKDTGQFDTEIGHQEEADYCLRLRMKGWKCAALPAIHAKHEAVATNDPASQERISRGVVRWVNKWNEYFCGKGQNYHSANVLRWDDWPPNALHIEEYWKRALPDLNREPEVIEHAGREYDLIKVPRYKDFYRGRII